MSKTHNTGRNFAAVSAHMRGNAGSMKDKRAPRGGARNLTAEYMEEMNETVEVPESDEDFVQVNPYADEMEGVEVIWHGCVPHQ